VAKPELGTKRICPETGRKFYDLGKSPVISPYTGEIVPIAVIPMRHRAEPAKAAAPVVATAPDIAPETTDAEFVSLDDVAAEEEGKKPAVAGEEGDEAASTDDTLDDAVFIEETEEGSADVTDIIGDGVEKDEET
jgi:uncharacterized protein (TIGR02300 family)